MLEGRLCGSESVWKRGQSVFCKFIFLLKFNFFLYILDYFDILILKIIFKNKKNIILIYFKIKNILKSNSNHISKQPESSVLLSAGIDGDQERDTMLCFD
jgi:hypothetical protein